MPDPILDAILNTPQPNPTYSGTQYAAPSGSAAAQAASWQSGIPGEDPGPIGNPSSLGGVTQFPQLQNTGTGVQGPPAPKPPGTLKRMLMGFFEGMAQPFNETQSEINQRNAMSQASLQNAATNEGYRQFQQKMGEFGMQNVDTPIGPMPKGTWEKLGPAYLRMLGVQDTNATRADINQSQLDSKESIANQQHELGKMKLDTALKIAQLRNIPAMQSNALKLRSMQEFGITPAMMSKGLSGFDDALLADKRLAVMQDALKNPNGQNDVAMLFNHIGMTLSAQKGARITNAEIERAIKTRDLPGGLMQMWDQVQSGRFLTPEQREQMVDLGVVNRQIAWENARRKAKLYGVTREPEQDPKLPPLSGAPLGGNNTGTVRIQLRDGRTGTIPASSLQKYIDQGAKVIQ